jgi:crotonobetainyl-CoA:carnitine CoA-transferase CaiB-like acyl-CoA transferase
MWTFTETPADITTTIGETGSDTRAVLADLGVSAEEIDELLSSGVAKTP